VPTNGLRKVSSQGTTFTTARPDLKAAIARYQNDRLPEVQASRRGGVRSGRCYAGSSVLRCDLLTVANDSSAFTSEALFRLGDSYFEIASTQRGAARRTSFARAAAAYERAAAAAPKDGDIYFLSLYKLGWSYYNQATQTSQAEYSKAVDVFGRLIDDYDKLTPQQQARLGLRSETIEYMAVAFTQVGGAEAANRYFAAHGGADYRLPVMRRVAFNLQEQGDFGRAANAYEAVITQAPNDSNAIGLQREIIDMYENRMLEPERAQQARLDLVNRFGPGSQWAQANANNAAAMDSAAVVPEIASSGRAVQLAQRSGRDKQSTRLRVAVRRYLREFPVGQRAGGEHVLRQALFSTGDYCAGTEYSRTACRYSDSTGAVAGVPDAMRSWRSIRPRRTRATSPRRTRSSRRSIGSRRASRRSLCRGPLSCRRAAAHWRRSAGMSSRRPSARTHSGTRTFR
jgi:tetratricopeptide (TPR) repeat protein